MSQHTPTTPAPRIDDVRVGIIAAEWNGHINERMTESALKFFDEYGVEAEVYHVPGAFELTFAASHLVEASLYDAIIVFGTVIRGGTPHFEYVCQSVTQGITQLNTDIDTPIIFGVLTVDCEQDAIDRVDGTVGDKGRECAEAAIKMVAFTREV